MHDSIDVSVVIVTWNSRNWIIECLRSAESSLNGLTAEFIVIDNASSDDTVDAARDAAAVMKCRTEIIINNSNKGFSAASNQGIAVSRGRNVLLLNPDISAGEESIYLLAKKLDEDTTLGAAAPQLINTDGSIQQSCRTFPEYWDMFCEFTLLSRFFPLSRKFARWKMNYFDHGHDAEVPQPMAAALLVRGDFIRSAGGFDEQFVMFFNDVDLCKRIYESGMKIFFVAGARMVHEKGASVNRNRKAMTDAWNMDCSRYFRKYFDEPMKQMLLNSALRVSGVVRKAFQKS